MLTVFTGAEIGELMSVGELIVDGRIVRAEDIATLSDGPVVAFVMDTAWCEGAIELAADADLLVCEATFLASDRAAYISGQNVTVDGGLSQIVMGQVPRPGFSDA